MRSSLEAQNSFPLFLAVFCPTLFPPDCHRHGKKKITRDELNARAKANGYQRRAHREENSHRDRNKHGDDTKKVKRKRWIAMCYKGAFSTF
jgi:ribosomal protein L44E